MPSGIWGKTYKLYKVPDMPRDSANGVVLSNFASNWVNCFPNKILVKDTFPLCYAETTETNMNILSANPLIDADGSINALTMSLMDMYYPMWQQNTYIRPFVLNDNRCTVLDSLFPHKFIVPDYEVYLIWDGETDNGLIFQFGDDSVYARIRNVNTGADANVAPDLPFFFKKRSDSRYYDCSGGFVVKRPTSLMEKTITGWISTSSGPANVRFSGGDTVNISTSNDFFTGADTDYKPPLDDTDPYQEGGNSEAGTGGEGGEGGTGGTGNFDNTSDTVSLPTLPPVSGLNTGFFTAFVPSAGEMNSLSNYLWNNLLSDILDPTNPISESIDALKKVIANPYDAIMGCTLIPVKPTLAGTKELKMYGIIQTGITLNYAGSRWVEINCGSLNIQEFWGGYLDYSPYTKTTSLYLPYIGTVTIDIDLIMAKTIQVVYHVDILTGICVAYILVDNSVQFHFQGQCGTTVPITNADYASVLSSAIGLVGNVSQVIGSSVTGFGAAGAGGAVAGAMSGAISQAPSIAQNVMGMKPDIRTGGAIGSSAGILSCQKPYLIIERPKQSLPEYQNRFTGYPSNITEIIGNLQGYTEFESINLDELFLTDNEKIELANLLKGGVYL